MVIHKYGRHFTIPTDHNYFRWLLSLREPPGRFVRWALRLQEFDFTVSCQTGRCHADPCRRRMLFKTATKMYEPGRRKHRSLPVFPCSCFPDAYMVKAEQLKDPPILCRHSEFYDSGSVRCLRWNTTQEDLQCNCVFAAIGGVSKRLSSVLYVPCMMTPLQAS